MVSSLWSTAPHDLCHGALYCRGCIAPSDSKTHSARYKHMVQFKKRRQLCSLSWSIVLFLGKKSAHMKLRIQFKRKTFLGCKQTVLWRIQCLCHYYQAGLGLCGLAWTKHCKECHSNCCRIGHDQTKQVFSQAVNAFEEVTDDIFGKGGGTHQQGNQLQE